MPSRACGPLHSVKLVYWGPGRSGKTTNLTWLHSRLRPELQGRLLTLDGPGERTVYFDSLPLLLDPQEGPGGGPKVQLRLYTVPGQPRFHLTRRLVLKGVDGLVFVWDSRSRRTRANVESLLEARETVAELGLSWDALPRVVQYNKRDLPDILDAPRIDLLLDSLNERGPRISTIASEGSGILATLAAVARLALRRRMGVAA